MQVTEVSMIVGGERVVATTRIWHLYLFICHPLLFTVLEREGGDGTQLINPDTLPEFSRNK